MGKAQLNGRIWSFHIQVPKERVGTVFIGIIPVNKCPFVLTLWGLLAGEGPTANSWRWSFQTQETPREYLTLNKFPFITLWGLLAGEGHT